MNVKVTDEKKLAFLAVLASTGQVGKAAEAIGVVRQTPWDWRKDDPNFDLAWDEAKRISATVLEDEAIRRARDGVDKPVFHQGMQCGAIREYSDTLMIFLLKAADPERFRDQARIELAGGLALEKMSIDELREEVASLMAGVGNVEAETGPSST